MNKTKNREKQLPDPKSGRSEEGWQRDYGRERLVLELERTRELAK